MSERRASSGRKPAAASKKSQAKRPAKGSTRSAPAKTSAKTKPAAKQTEKKGGAPGAAKPGAKAEPAGETVNLSELSYVTGVSTNTLREIVQRHDDFPVVYSGRNGVAYEFPLQDAVDWLQRHEEEQQQAEAERQSQLKLWRDQMYGDAGGAGTEAARQLAEDLRAGRRRKPAEIAQTIEDLAKRIEREDASVSPAERKAEAEAVRLEDYNRRRRGELVEVGPLKASLASAIVAVRNAVMQVPAQAARDLGLDRETRIELDRRTEAALNRLAAELADLGRDDDPEEDRDDAAA